MKRIGIFAAINKHKGGKFCLYAIGIFYALLLQIYGVTPVQSVNAPAALVVLINGSVAPFFHATMRTYNSEMINTEKKCLKGKGVPKSNRITGTKSELIQKVLLLEQKLHDLQKSEDQETRIKNKLYAFILNYNLLDLYLIYLKQRNANSNPHSDCVESLFYNLIR